jgi:predicted AlkP superfamily phosphohydrolase/phosphomutase
MSSMTEEELNELKTLCSIYIPTDSPIIGFEDYGIVVFTHHLTNNMYSFKLNMCVIDWLNAHHFDYRGLIEKGLALEAPEGMYK